MERPNLEFWEDLARLHGATPGPGYYDIDALVEGRSSLRDIELAGLAATIDGGVDGLRIAHVQSHIGIDTIRLQGEGFSPRVVEGQHVKSGETLIEFSLDTITSAGLDPVVMMVVTNGERFSLTPGNTDDKNPDPHIIMTLKESV